MSTFNAAKCEQRRRLAARRDGVEAVPMRLFRAAPDPVPDSGLLYAQGTLPATLEAALTTIHALQPEGATALTADQIYIHYLEAGNNGFVPDRFMFLDETTLRNIRTDAVAGAAFMNSHRDGSLSHPADLPMGRTFAGRYEQGQDGSKRALLGFYMRAGTAPNGAQGPTTDDLHLAISAGTVFDVSVGLYGGERICDVCGNDVTDAQLCTHAPGTARNLTPDQRAAQTARGVRGGMASYSLLHARLGEVSAVYDGAVPGAGFRKTLSLARSHALTRPDIQAAARAYAGLWQTGDLDMAQIEDLEEAVEGAFTRALRAVGFGGHRGSRAALLDAEPLDMAVSTLRTTPDPEKEELRARLAVVETERAAERLTQNTALAKSELDNLILGQKVYPAQNSNGQGTGLLAFLLTAPGTIRLANGADVSPAEALRQFIGAAPAHELTGEAIPVSLVPGGPQGKGDLTPADRAARKARLKALAGHQDVLDSPKEA